MKRRPVLALLTVLWIAGACYAADPPWAALDAARVSSQTGVRSGLVVVIGKSDIAWPSMLAASGRYVVQMLVYAEQVDGLRHKALAEGVHGPLSISLLPADGRLPYPSRFVDLVIADLQAPGCPALAELHRVTNLGGTLLLQEGGAWKVSTRPAEPGIAGWTHKWYDATGNNVSADDKVAPPQTIQWQAGPALADGAGQGKHPVIGGGAFACVDSMDGSLAVRSAGNGLIRWRSRPVLSPYVELLIDDDRLLTRADPEERLQRVMGRFEAGLLMSFDLATGASRPLPEAPVMPVDDRHRLPRDDCGFPSSVVAGDTLVVCAGGDLAALEKTAGSRRWTVTLRDGIWFSPRILDDQVIAVECPKGKGIVSRGRVDSAYQVTAVCAFGLADGKPRWRTSGILERDGEPERPSPNSNAESRPGKPGPSKGFDAGFKRPRASLKPLTCADGKVFLYASSYQCRADDAFIMALDARTGRQLWRFASLEGSSKGRKNWSRTDSSAFILYRGGELFYVSGFGNVSGFGAGAIAVFDPETGRMKGPPHSAPGQGYGACGQTRATVNWFINSAATWNDKDFNQVDRPAARGQCGSGGFPAQGMFYVTPTGCDCRDFARGYLGMASDLPPRVPEDGRWTAGPGQPGNVQPRAGDWPVFLANPQRTANTAVGLPRKLVARWTVAAAPRPIAGPLLDDRQRDEYWIGALTAPTIAGGLVFAGMPEAHAVAAIDLATGQTRWRAPVGAAVDTPPTIARGLCLFGCQDGCIYALSADDGRVVWKFNAALGLRAAMLNGRLASALPAPGSVVVQGDRVWATAGYHTYLGGVAVWILDLATGKPLAQHRLVGGKPEEKIPNFLNDILCAADNGSLWIGQDLQILADGSLAPDVGRKRYPKPQQHGDVPLVAMSRRSSLVAFTHAQRGGSTHAWFAPAWMPCSYLVRFHRMVVDGQTVYGLGGDTHARSALECVALPADPKSRPLRKWSLTNQKDFAEAKANTALIKAGDRLYMGCGSYDGIQGAVYIVSTEGEILERLDLPARAAPGGLAAAGGRLVAACVDGSLVAFGAP